MTASDDRIKTSVVPLPFGLDAIVAMEPIIFLYRGNDTNTQPTSGALAPYPNSPHYQQAAAQQPITGLSAQSVEAVVPEMVSKRSGYIDGMKVPDLRDINTEPLLFILVNAVRELAQRLDALDGGGAATKPAGDDDGGTEQADEEKLGRRHQPARARGSTSRKKSKDNAKPASRRKK